MNPINPAIAQSSQRLLESIKAKANARTPEDRVQEERRRTQAESESGARQRSGAPKRHWYAAEFKGDQWLDKLHVVQRMLGSGATIGLFGTRGAGKTQMAVEAMRVAWKSGKSTRFISASEFFSLIKATYKADSKLSEHDVIGSLRSPGLLVIDEIGKRGQTDWEDGLLFDLLDKRYQDESDTILTCNLDHEGFTSVLGPSILSRMNEGGGLIHFDWQSYRTPQ